MINFIDQNLRSQGQWPIPVILMLVRLRQEDCLKFKVSLGYRVEGASVLP